MLLKRLHQHCLCHFESIVQSRQLFIAFSLLCYFSRYGAEGSIKVIDTFDQVLREAGDSEVAGSLNVALCAFLKVAKFCYRTEIFILHMKTCKVVRGYNIWVFDS